MDEFFCVLAMVGFYFLKLNCGVLAMLECYILKLNWVLNRAFEMNDHSELRITWFELSSLSVMMLAFKVEKCILEAFKEVQMP
mgnify:CR=1 FL=1